jgi:hypothetical protein
MSVTDILSLIADLEKKELASKTPVEFIYKNQKYFPKSLSLGESSVIFNVTRDFYKKLPLTELKRQIKDLGTVAENSEKAMLKVDGKPDAVEISSHYLSSDALELVSAE